MVRGRVATLSKRKLGFHSKHNATMMFQKIYTTHDALSVAVSPLAPPATPLAPLATSCGFACNCRATAHCCCRTPLLPHRSCLHFSSMFQNKNASQPAGLCGTGRPALPPLILIWFLERVG